MVRATSRADGSGPNSWSTRDTRPPSSSMVTMSGTALASATCAASPFASIDSSVQLPMKMPPMPSDFTTSRASAYP